MMDKPRLYTILSAFSNPQCLRILALEKGIEDELEEALSRAAP